MATPTPVGGGRVSRGGNRTKVLQVAPKQQQILQQQQAALASQLLMPGSLMQVYIYKVLYIAWVLWDMVQGRQHALVRT